MRQEHFLTTTTTISRRDIASWNALALGNETLRVETSKDNIKGHWREEIITTTATSKTTTTVLTDSLSLPPANNEDAWTNDDHSGYVVTGSLRTNAGVDYQV